MTGITVQDTYGEAKANGAEARSSEELKFLSSQATLSYRVAVATDAPFASAGRRKECVGRGCQYTEGVRKTRQEPSAVPRSM